jgi:lipopolysaccharide export system permease protein
MGILARYVTGLYLTAFAGIMSLGVVLSTTIDFFGRIGDFAEDGATGGSMAAYFLLKAPSIVPELFPLATLLSVLFTFGSLARHHELMALNACGVLRRTILLPLLASTALLTLGVGIWNETVVPGTAQNSRYIKDIVIKKKHDRGLYNSVSLWYQGARGFFNIGYFDANRNALYGLTLYEATPEFVLERVIEVDTGVWREGSWEFSRGVIKTLQPDGTITISPLAPGDLVLEESPTTLRRKRRSSDTFSFAQLLDRIRTLQARGLDANEFVTDLHAKVSQPFAGIVTLLVGYVVGIRDRRRPSLALNGALGLSLALVYWLSAAAAIAAGRNGAMPPAVAAWVANLLFLALAATLGMRGSAFRS